MSIVLSTEHLTKKYGKKYAVKDLSLRVPTKSIYGFIGSNGAGKTTTFGMLGGAIIPSSGTFHCTGKLSLLPQDARFYHGRSILGQLQFFAELSGTPKNASRAEVMHSLEAVGLAEKYKLSPEKLSHGMYKRLGIAQTLLGNPEVIILDEPTAGLDPETAHEIRQLIKSLHQEKTVIISSHNLSELSDMCTHFGIIHEGTLLFEGKASDMIHAESVVTYGVLHLEGKNISFDDVPWVLKLEILEHELVFHIDQKAIQIEEANKYLLTRLWEQGIGVREIMLGKSLEESFFALIGKDVV